MNDHYFTAEPASADERRTLNLRLAGRTVPMQTAPGVFCPDRLDQGTAVLLAHAPQPAATGRFLDVGCGWGAISISLGLLAPKAQVLGVDVNHRALELCNLNAAANELPNVHACLPTQIEADARFDLIWSNPPIRVGKPALHRLLLTWVPRLVIGGEAYLVVQRNLGSDSLQTWLASALTDAFEVSRFTSARGFRILHVRRLTDAGPTPLAPSDDAVAENG